MTAQEVTNLIFLNSKNCFFCLKRIIKEEDDDGEGNFSSDNSISNGTSNFSLFRLCKYLKINLSDNGVRKGLKNFYKNEGKLFQEVEIEVSTCYSCQMLGEQLSNLLLELEKIQIKIYVCLKSLNKEMVKPGGQTMIQDNSEGCGNEGQFVVVDKLRKEIIAKCSCLLKPNSSPVLSTNARINSSEEIRTSQNYSEDEFKPSIPEEEFLSAMTLPAAASPELQPSPFSQSTQPPTSVGRGRNKNPKVHKCNYCNKLFTRKFNAQVHLKSCKAIPGKSSREDIKEEPQEPGEDTKEKTSGTGSSSSNTANRFICSHCPASFKHDFSLRQHEKIHTDKGEKCPFCCKTYCSKSVLERHMSVHRKDKPFTCHICGKALKTPESLSYHLDTHNLPEERTKAIPTPASCPICNKVLFSGGKLKGHMRTHTGERPFQCQFCPKAFALKRNLSEHEEAHTMDEFGDGRKVKCQTCGKIVASKRALKAHMKSH